MSIVQRTQPLIPISPSNMSDEAFSSMATASKFLPRIQIFGSSSKAVKTGQFPVGHYGLVVGKDKNIDLGEQFDCLPINVRPKAMDITGKQIVSRFDHESDEFASIRDRAGTPNSGCMFGPEFLLWLPAQKRFATMFFLNPTMRREAPDMKERLGHATTCSIVFIPSQQYGGWHGPVITDCTTPFDLPDLTEMKVQLEQFLAATPEVEEVEEVEGETRAR